MYSCRKENVNGVSSWASAMASGGFGLSFLFAACSVQLDKSNLVAIYPFLTYSMVSSGTVCPTNKNHKTTMLSRYGHPTALFYGSNVPTRHPCFAVCQVKCLAADRLTGVSHKQPAPGAAVFLAMLLQASPTISKPVQRRGRR